MSLGWLALLAAPIVGSFLTVLIVRLPRGEGVVLGRSRCRACAHPLAPIDLIPVLGWLLRRGRCRYCGVPIGSLYPSIELAAVGVAGWALLGVPEEMVWPTAFLGWTLLALAVIDWRSLVLPDILTLPLAAVGLATAMLIDTGLAWAHLLGVGLGWLSFRLIGALYAKLRGREGLGRGDAKLMAAAGAWVSWQGLPTVILVAALAALAAVGLLAAAGKRVGHATAIPFGPFLALGLWLTWLYGPLLLFPTAALR